MKTKEELTKLAFEIAALVFDRKSSEAIRLLDALYIEGTLDAAKVKSSFQTPEMVP